MKPGAVPLLPLYTLDDFTLPPWTEQRDPWTEPRTYRAAVEVSGVKAYIQFRWRDGERQRSQPDVWKEPPGYVMDQQTSRANEHYGMMGRKQQERAKALFPLLEAEVRSALHAAGWPNGVILMKITQ